jgi:peptidoglycan/LPS O-acetylase OafA/YrhL
MREPAVQGQVRYDYIDALRGYAILLVIFVHSSQMIGGLPALFYQIADQGARGVQLFFVASAITLCMSWHRRHDGVGSFYVRRTFRIAPMFWLAILYFTLVDGLGPRGLEPDGIGAKHILLTAMFGHGFLPSTFSSVVPGGWSIAVEMMFYTVFPILISTINSWRTAATAAAVALVPAAFTYASIQSAAKQVEPHSWSVIYQVFSTLNFVHQLPVFLIGMAAYFIIRDEEYEVARRPFQVAFFSLMPLVVVLEAFHRFGIGWVEFGFHSSSAVAFAGIAIALARTPHTIFVNPYIIWIGKISFSGYLWHLALIHAVPANLAKLAPTANFVWFYLALTALTVAASSVTYVVVEKPFIALGNGFLQRLRSGEDVQKKAVAA